MVGVSAAPSSAKAPVKAGGKAADKKGTPAKSGGVRSKRRAPPPTFGLPDDPLELLPEEVRRAGAWLFLCRPPPPPRRPPPGPAAPPPAARAGPSLSPSLPPSLPPSSSFIPLDIHSIGHSL